MPTSLELWHKHLLAILRDTLHFFISYYVSCYTYSCNNLLERTQIAFKNLICLGLTLLILILIVSILSIMLENEFCNKTQNVLCKFLIHIQIVHWFASEQSLSLFPIVEERNSFHPAPKWTPSLQLVRFNEFLLLLSLTNAWYNYAWFTNAFGTNHLLHSC